LVCSPPAALLVEIHATSGTAAMASRGYKRVGYAL
jgi:hypothetical protein